MSMSNQLEDGNSDDFPPDDDTPAVDDNDDNGELVVSLTGVKEAAGLLVSPSLGVEAVEATGVLSNTV